MAKTNEHKSICDPYASIRLDHQICFPLYACSKEVIRRYRTPLEKLNLTYTQYIVMMVLWEHGTMIEKELGAKVYLASGTLAPLLKRLEAQNLITRRRTPEDERTLQVVLTDEGSALRETALSIPQEMAGCMGLTEPEAESLYKLLYKALHSMQPERDGKYEEEL